MSERRPRPPLLRLAWRNTRRNSRRTLLTMSAVLVASASLTFAFSYLEGMIDEVVDTYARTQSGHVRITASGYTERERFLPLDKNVPRLSELLPIIRTHPAVRGAVARIRTAALVDGVDSNRPAMVWGIDLEQERDYLRPAGMLYQGRLPAAGAAEALVGTGLAERIGAAVGDTLTLLGQTAYRSLGGLRCTVSGLARSGVGYLDEALLLLPLDQAQYMTFLDDAATEVLVFAHDPDRAEALAASLAAELDPLVEGGLEVLSWHDQGPLIQLMDTAGSMWGILILLLMLMAGLVIVNTMFMSVMERTAEFGMLGALGLRPGDILRLVLSEGMVIGLVGAVAGVVLGGGIALLLQHTGMDFSKAMAGIELPFPNTIYPHLTVQHPLIGLAVGVLTAVLASLYPAWRAVRLQPAEALRA
jgi:putative ABC transport system permease protein